MKPHVLCVLIFFLLACIPLRASGEISEQQALEVANKAIAKYDVYPPQWNVRLDKDRHDWQITREAWEKWVATVARGRAADINARIEQIETAMKGREVWLAVYNRVVLPGQVARHSHAIVFLDANSGEILDVINPEQ